MKIHLIDFKCYKDESFDFGEGGMALLSGPSGQGKSSIIQGIYFALFGVGTKVAAYGKTSCKVVLEFDGMKIVRTKRPNRLIVNDVYEDEAAQDIINQKFGDTFDVTGYISQNALNSFVLMNPMDKLSFLEKFAFRDVDLTKIKGRCKGHISKANEELLITGAKLSQVKQMFDEMKKPDKVVFPLKCKIADRDKAIKNEGIRFKNCATKIKRSLNMLKKLRTELNDIRVLEATIASRKESLENIKSDINDLDESEIEYEGDDFLDDLHKRLDRCVARRELVLCEEKYTEYKNNLEAMRLEEAGSIQDEISDMESALWAEYSKEEIEDVISDQVEYIKDIEKLDVLKKETITDDLDLEQMERELESIQGELQLNRELYTKIKEQENVYKCPCCESKLRFSDGVLTEFDKDIVDHEVDISSVLDNINNLKKAESKKNGSISSEKERLKRKKEAQNTIDDITSLYDEIIDVDSATGDLEYIRHYRFTQVDKEKRLSKLKISLVNEDFSSSYTSMMKTNKVLEDKLLKLREVVGEDLEESTESELRAIISVQERNREKLIEMADQKEELILKRDKCIEILSNCEKSHMDNYGSVRCISDIEQEISTHNNDISVLEREKSEHESNLEKISEWNEYNDELIKYETWKKKMDNLKEKETEDVKNLASANTLKDKIMEAESIAMLNIIESINTHAQLYLECFFPDNPISVRLQPFKQTKKTVKPQINIEVEYKGMECDLNMLSGGELSRVILAYTLALAEMFNTPLLLLDECTASLDQELTSTVFEGIKDNFNGKLALIIAHQVVTGAFDTKVNLGGGVI